MFKETYYITRSFYSCVICNSFQATGNPSCVLLMGITHAILSAVNGDYKLLFFDRYQARLYNVDPNLLDTIFLSEVVV